MKKTNGKILVIDDAESILFLLESILSSNFEVISVNNAKKALKIVDESFNTTKSGIFKQFQRPNPIYS